MTNIRGGEGGGSSGAGGRGGETVGVRFDGCRDCVVEGGSMFDAQGGPAGLVSEDRLPGGDVIAVDIVQSPGAVVRGAVAFRLEGGPGGWFRGQQYSAGGRALGVRVRDSLGVRIDSVDLRALLGGAGVRLGDVLGVESRDSDDLSVAHLLVRDLEGHRATGFDLSGRDVRLSLTTVDRLTAHADDGAASYAVRVRGERDDLLVTSSILTGWSDHGVVADHLTSDVHVEYSDLWPADAAVGPPAPAPLVRSVPGAGFIQADPLFQDRQSYALAVESPCVDAGDPDLCVDEPLSDPGDGEGGRCLTDMGHNGATAAALGL